MTEISRIPWNGYKVVSTFSGAGGSCLGYRMAGYHVVWANEFLPAAQETYRANHPDTFLNCNNIREVSADDIIRESGIPKGQIDLFDGSPPCSSFSMAGARERHWGETKKYSDTVERTDDLFFEYIRLLHDLQPKTFVAENVAGLARGTAKGYFKMFLKGMADAGYEVQARLINAKFLGVPQSRERIIFVGVRKDLVTKYKVQRASRVPGSTEPCGNAGGSYSRSTKRQGRTEGSERRADTGSRDWAVLTSASDEPIEKCFVFQFHRAIEVLQPDSLQLSSAGSYVDPACWLQTSRGAVPSVGKSTIHNSGDSPHSEFPR